MVSSVNEIYRYPCSSYSCSMCSPSASFQNRPTLIRHRETVHPGVKFFDMFHCSKCSFKYPQLSKASQHFRRHHNESDSRPTTIEVDRLATQEVVSITNVDDVENKHDSQLNVLESPLNLSNQRSKRKRKSEPDKSAKRSKSSTESFLHTPTISPPITPVTSVTSVTPSPDTTPPPTPDATSPLEPESPISVPVEPDPSINVNPFIATSQVPLANNPARRRYEPNFRNRPILSETTPNLTFCPHQQNNQTPSEIHIVQHNPVTHIPHKAIQPQRRLSIRKLPRRTMEKLHHEIGVLNLTSAPSISTSITWTDAQKNIETAFQDFRDVILKTVRPQRKLNDRRNDPDIPDNTDMTPDEYIQNATTELQIDVTQAEKALEDAKAARRLVQGPSREHEREVRRRKRALHNKQERRDNAALQNFFKNSEKDCIRTILNDNSEEKKCNISIPDLTTHFMDQQQHQPVDLTQKIAQKHLHRLIPSKPTTDDEALSAPVTLEELKRKINSLPRRSAPGPDGITYETIKQLKEFWPTLLSCINKCIEFKKIPNSWKTSLITLLYKKGDEKEPINWRPLSLQNAAYKIYAGIISDRLTKWAVINKSISRTQKGFIPVDGTSEHGFISTVLVSRTRRLHKHLYQVWYDLKNAFPSISLDHLYTCLATAGIPTAAIDIIKDIYTDSFTQIRTPHGFTPRCPNQRGVKQGCPLSPILFNFAIEPLLRAFNSKLESAGVNFPPTERRLNHLAFADDIKIFGSSFEEVKQLNEIVEEFTQWTLLEVNTPKCAMLAIQNGKDDTRPLRLTTNGKLIPRINTHESYKYLGLPDTVSRNRQNQQFGAILHSTREKISKIFKSRLLPWQKFHAVKTYALPSMEFMLKNCDPHLRPLAYFDSELRRQIKHELHLPQSATNDFIYSPISEGGLGFIKTTDQIVCLKATHILKMLNSSDPTVADISRSEILALIKKRYTGPSDMLENSKIPHLVVNFLNGTLEQIPELQKRQFNSDITTITSTTPQRLARLRINVKLQTPPTTFSVSNSFTDNQSVQPQQQTLPKHPRLLFTVKDNTNPKPIAQRSLLKYCHDYCHNLSLSQWKNKADQGRTVEYHSEIGCKWIRHGGILTPQEYRFTFKARLNLLPTAQVKHQRGHARSPMCPRCRHPNETLAHTLQQCFPNMECFKNRHDTILEQIRKTTAIANQNRLLFINQGVRDCSGLDRPDIQLIDEPNKTISFIDLTTTFEDHSKNNFQIATDKKKDKYKQIKEHFEDLGYNVSLDALVYGSLGSVRKENHTVLTQMLNIPKPNAIRLESLCSMLAIKGSLKAWNNYQYQFRKHSARPQPIPTQPIHTPAPQTHYPPPPPPIHPPPPTHTRHHPLFYVN